MSNDLKSITIKRLELIKDICINHDDTCKNCPYSDDSGDPCMIFDITKSFPDTWNINTAEGE